MVDFNRTYSDGVVKTTVNIEKDLMGQAYQRMKKLGLRPRGHFSVYLRALIRKDVEAVNPMSLTEFLREKDQHGQNIEYLDPPRKYHGFVGGLMRNSFVYGWFRKRNNKY